MQKENEDLLDILKRISKILDNLEYERCGRNYKLDENEFSYVFHCRDLANEAIRNHKNKNVDKCDKCKPEDHEGVFCRCEMRNIQLAKQLRETGKSPWKTND